MYFFPFANFSFVAWNIWKQTSVSIYAVLSILVQCADSADTVKTKEDEIPIELDSIEHKITECTSYRVKGMNLCIDWTLLCHSHTWATSSECNTAGSYKNIYSLVSLLWSFPYLLFLVNAVFLSSVLQIVVS